MKPESKESFATPQPVPPKLTMMAAIRVARDALTTMTALDFDSVGRCERRSDGGWIVHLDVIESIARMGDNDLLATYAVDIDAGGDPLQVNRTRRYHREDRDQS
jgi:hypothetical protein